MRKNTELLPPHARKIYGEVYINLPVPYTTMMLGLSIIVILCVIFSCCVDYTQHYLVRGYLNVSSGVANVYPLHAGIISQCLVKEGQTIDKGDVLYRISTTQDQSTAHDTREYQLLHQTLQRLAKTIQIKNQYLQSLQPLLRRHFVSQLSYQQAQDQLNILRDKQQHLQMALMRYQASRVYVIRAPISGVISSLAWHLGQSVTPTRPLLTIMPRHTTLVANLYVPVAKSGFIKTHTPIVLHYDAYPYRHFGVVSGRIGRITKSILSDRDEDKPFDIGEPYYKVTAYLDKQTLVVNGHEHHLLQGMTLDALIPGMRKPLWRWIFEMGRG